MTFKHSLYLSFAVHLLLFGSAIAIAHYAGGTSAFFPKAIQVSLVSSGPGSGRGAVIVPRSRPRSQEVLSQTADLPGEQRNEVQQNMPAVTGTTSLAPAEEKGTLDQIGDSNEGGPGITSAGYGSGIDQGFALTAPEQWSAIESAIERTKKYPRFAVERGIEGVVRLRFRLTSEGSVEKIEIIESSGSDILDKASVSAVYRAAPMPAVRGWVEIPVKYVLK